MRLKNLLAILIKVLNISTSIILAIGGVMVLYYSVPVFGHKALIVKSGSMVPTLPVGSVLIIQTSPHLSLSTSRYGPGDVITFQSNGQLTSHRVTGISSKDGVVYYATKGDANMVPDPLWVPQPQVLGKKLFILPEVGSFLSQLKEFNSLYLLVILLSLAVIVYETRTIVKEIRKPRVTQRLTAALLVPLVLGSVFVSTTLARTLDTGTSTNNILAASTAFPSPTPTATPSPTVTPTYTPTPTPLVTPTTTPTPTVSPSVSPTLTVTPTPSLAPSVSPTPSVTPTPSQTPTPTVSPTVVPSPTPSVSPTPPPYGSHIVINEVFYNVDAAHDGSGCGLCGVLGTVSNTNTGAGSTNSIGITNTSTCTVSQSSSITTTSAISATTLTGGNSASNILGISSVQTGGASTLVNVTNSGNINNGGCTEGDRMGHQWIELYNPTNEAVDLKDWTLTDNSGQFAKIHGSHVIAAHGFLLISKSSLTWRFWPLCSADKISTGGFIGNGLEDSDRLILKNSQDQTVDALSWGSDTSVFTLSGVQVGKSLGRKTVGVDSDAPTDWVETIPSPGS